MQNRTILNCLPKVGLLLFFAIMISSCEKIDEDLMDPAEAGKWALYNTSTGLTGNQVRGAFCDSKGNMWFAVSSNGAAKYSNGVWTYYKTSNSGILSNGITCCEEDNDGNILFGTTNGRRYCPGHLVSIRGVDAIPW